MTWRTTQEEQEDIDSLSEWLRTAKSLILKRMKVLGWSMSANATPVFKDPKSCSKNMKNLLDTHVLHLFKQ